MGTPIKDKTVLGSDIAQQLSPLDLNNIKLDDKHTVLTPEYLEGKQSSTEMSGV